VSNVLKGIGARIDQVPAEFIDTAIDIFVDSAERHGGRMMGRQLTAEAHHRHVAGGVASVTMVGVPARLWAWREGGTRPHIIRAHGDEPLALSGHPVWGPVRHPGIQPQHRWTAACVDAETRIYQAAAHAVTVV